MRLISALLLAQFTWVMMAPGWVVADFLLERNRIARDLCVQRMVADGQRTCHGECQLMKRMEQSAGREQSLPAELRAYRISEVIVDAVPSVVSGFAVERQMAWAPFSADLQDGFPRRVAPVPWC